MARQGISALLSLIIFLGACGKEEMPPPTPGCSRILAVAKSERSPQGPTKRFVNQPLLMVELTAPKGEACQNIVIDSVDLDLPDAFYKMTLPREGERLFIDQVDAVHEIHWQGYPVDAFDRPFIVKPGETKRFIVAFNTTMFEPGTQGRAVLKDLRWHAESDLADRRSLTQQGSAIEGNIVSFNRTLMDICQAAEDKIEMLQMPLKGWTCDYLGAVDFSVYAPEDQKSCRMWIKNAMGPGGVGSSLITPEQIKSAGEVELMFDGEKRFKCTHS